jgi:hypothetical protein
MPYNADPAVSGSATRMTSNGRFGRGMFGMKGPFPARIPLMNLPVNP